MSLQAVWNAVDVSNCWGQVQSSNRFFPKLTNINELAPLASKFEIFDDELRNVGPLTAMLPWSQRKRSTGRSLENMRSSWSFGKTRAMTYLQQELTKRGVLLPLPLHLQPLCLKSPCCPPAQAPHTNKYASITLPSLSTISFHSLSSVGSTLADPDGHLGRALLSLWWGLWYKSPTPSLNSAIDTSA